jgi:hypothetical protein
VLGGAPGTVSQQTLEHVVGAVVFGVLAYVAKACFLGDSIRLVYDGDDNAWQLRASLGAILLLSVAALSVRSALAAAADEALAAPRPDGERVPPRAGQESEIPNFKGSYLGRFPLVSADFWTSDHLSERS